MLSRADTSDEGKLSAVWVGQTGDLKISKVTSFGVEDLYFTTTVTLKNTGSSSLHDVKYMRNVDPDQEQPWTGSYTTKNYVKYQRTDRPHADYPDMALVVAYGPSHPQCVLGLGTVHPNAYVTHYGFQNNDAEAGFTNTAWKSYTEASPRSADEGINVVFKFDKLDPGASTTFSWAYVLNEADLIKAMRSISDIKIVQPSDTVSGTAASFSADVHGDHTLVSFVEFFISSSTSSTKVGTATSRSSDTSSGSLWAIEFNSKTYSTGDYTFKASAKLTDGSRIETTKVVRIDNTGPAIRFEPVPTGLTYFPKTTLTTVTVVKDTSVSSPDPTGVRFFREVLGETVSLGTDTTSPYVAGLCGSGRGLGERARVHESPTAVARLVAFPGTPLRWM